MKLCKENLWEEEDDRDDRAFLKLEKEIWKEMLPHGAELLEAEEEEVQEVEEEGNRVGEGKILIENADINNDNQDSVSDMPVGLDET